VQKDSIVALYQHRDPLIQEAGLPSLARARSDPPSLIIIIIIIIIITS